MHLFDWTANCLQSVPNHRIEKLCLTGLRGTRVSLRSTMAIPCHLSPNTLLNCLKNSPKAQWIFMEETSVAAISLKSVAAVITSRRRN